MTLPNKNFCVLPWISLETSPIGTLRPCCLAEEEIVDEHSTKFNLATANLNQVQDSVYMYQLRQQFLKGNRPDTCRKCWNEEDAGRISKRMHTIKRLEHVIDNETWTHASKPLKFLDLKLGNICNLKCRICGSWSSSQFAVEEIKFSKPGQADYHKSMLRKGAWPKENQVFWNQIDRLIDQIEYIEFTGGEPFMINEHFDMLQKIVDRGRAPHVEIHYNTNGTHYPEHAEDIWQNFNTVEIAFSIDDVDRRFEYQRTNANWNQVVDNIEKFKQLKSRHANIQLQVCSTVNIFNVMYLEELAHWIDKQGFDFIYWNMLHQAPFFNISNLPIAAKTIAAERLRTSKVRPFHQQEFERIINFMQSDARLDVKSIVDKIHELDSRRGQSLCADHQLLAEALGYADT